MIEKHEIELKKNMQKFISDNLFNNKQIVVFGSNEPAERIIDLLYENQINVTAMIDNNEKKTGCTYKNIIVNKPEKILMPYSDNIVILIASKYYSQMLQQLQKMGYYENIQVFKIINLNKNTSYSLEIDTFNSMYSNVESGLEVYCNIINKFSSEMPIFICPYGALGDVYIVGRFWNEYISKNNLKEYIFVVVQKGCEKVAKMFSIKNVINISMEDMDKLVQFSIFAGLSDLKIKILHQRFPYTASVGIMGNYKNLNFADQFRYSILGLDESAKMQLPDNNLGTINVEDFFEKHNLIIGKTVILSPYANTISKLPEKHWIKIIQPYIKEGYTIITNSSGSHEPAILGTEAVFFDLWDAIKIIETAGVFIGLRSGFCDVISTAIAKKIILYPDRKYQNGEMIDFYSLKNMAVANGSLEEIVIK